MAAVKSRPFALAALVAGVALLLTGCNPGPGAVEHYAGEAHDAIVTSEPSDNGTTASWLHDGGRIAVTMLGSSTCPPIGTGMHLVSDAAEGNAVSVTVADTSSEICTRDLVPHTTVFWTPVHVTTTQPLKIEVLGETVTLPVK